MTKLPTSKYLLNNEKSSFVEQVEYEGARHLQSARLPSVGKESVIGLRIYDVTAADKCLVVRGVASTLKRLDMSETGMLRLPGIVFDELTRLEQVNVSGNELTDLTRLIDCPAAGKIVEVLAKSNRFAQLPANLNRFTVIQRLDLSCNKISSWNGIESLATLRELVVDENLLPSMKPEFYEQLKNLKLFHCANNQIQTIYISVRHMTQLKDLNLSGNKLTTIPKELLLLPHLDVLNVSSNALVQVPTLPTKRTCDPHRISSVDLSDNRLLKFPEQLLSICENLDVSKNDITRIPNTVELLLTIADGSKILTVNDNPLVSPPQDICENGARSILRFFQEERINRKIYRGLKVSLVGASGQGKTSLVKALIDERSYLTGRERTHLLDINNHTITVGEETVEEDHVTMEKTIRLSMWDFSGSERYQTFPLYQFIYHSSVVILVFSLVDYKNDTDFLRLIGDWLNWIVVRTHKLVLIPVATHVDKVSRKRADEICQSVLSGIARFIVSYSSFIEIRSDENVINQNLATKSIESNSVKLHGFASKRFVAFVHPKVVRISSLKYEGFDELSETIKSIANDANTRPCALAPIPSLWNQIIHHVSLLALTLPVPYLTWDDYESELTEKFGMKTVLPQVTQYLNDCGQILWLTSKEKRLKDYVILKPSWFVDLLRPIFELAWSLTRSTNPGTAAIQILKRDLQSHGIIGGNDLLKSLWRHVIPDGSSRQVILDAMELILDKFELGYPILGTTFVKGYSGSIPQSITHTAEVSTPRRSESRQNNRPASRKTTSRSSNEQNSSSGCNASGIQKKAEAKQSLGPYVIGCLRTGSEPPNLRDVIDDITTQPNIVAVYRFPKYAPPSLFHAIVVRAKLTNFDLSVVSHWNAGFYAFHKTKPVRLLLQFCSNVEERNSEETLISDSHASILRVRGCTTSSGSCESGSLCDRSPAYQETRDFKELWGVMTPLLNNIDLVLNLFPGLCFERRMECPACHEPTFPAAWSTCAPLQTEKTVTCALCLSVIDVKNVCQVRQMKEDFSAAHFTSKTNQEDDDGDKTIIQTQNQKFI